MRALGRSLIESHEFHDSGLVQGATRDGVDNVEAVKANAGFGEVEAFRASLGVPSAQLIVLVAGDESAETRAH